MPLCTCRAAGSQGPLQTVRFDGFPAAISTGFGPRGLVRHATTREGGAPAMSDTISISTHPAPPVWSNPPGRLYMTSDLRAATGLPRTHMDYYLREGLIVPTTRSES